MTRVQHDPPRILRGARAIPWAAENTGFWLFRFLLLKRGPDGVNPFRTAAPFRRQIA